MDFQGLLQKITPALRYIARKRLFISSCDEEDLFQEMCLYLWQHYGQGLPIGINEAYVIKGCEFHILNFLRKGRPKVGFLSLDEFITSEDLTLGDILEDKREDFRLGVENQLTVDAIMARGLTDREKLVFSYLLKGYTLREVAKELAISHVMVLKYKKNIVRKWQNKKRLPK